MNENEETQSGMHRMGNNRHAGIMGGLNMGLDMDAKQSLTAE